LQQDRIKIFVGDQSVSINMSGIFTSLQLKPNIIIDDGSHQIPHQQITLGAIFKYLASGGFYVIEDIVQYDLTGANGSLFASPAAFHGNQNSIPMAYSSIARHQESLKSTTLSLLIQYCSTGKIDSPYISKEDAEYIEQNIEYCNIHKSNIFNLHIAFIRKK
jgi:hypothetical protein